MCHADLTHHSRFLRFCLMVSRGAALDGFVFEVRGTLTLEETRQKSESWRGKASRQWEWLLNCYSRHLLLFAWIDVLQYFDFLTFLFCMLSDWVLHPGQGGTWPKLRHRTEMLHVIWCGYQRWCFGNIDLSKFIWYNVDCNLGCMSMLYI